MSIYFDPPRAVNFKRFKTTAHCMSDQIGEEGTKELLAFGAKIGLLEAWLQKPGTPHEHFDLFDGKIEAARRAGAVEVRGVELIQRCVNPKRGKT